MAGEGASIYPLDGRNIVALQIAVQTGFSAPVAKFRAIFSDYQPAQPGFSRFIIQQSYAIITDKRVGQADNFAPVGGVGANFLIARHGSVEADFTVDFAFGASFSWPILNYGQITNNVRVQDARLQGLLIDYRNTVLSAQRDVEKYCR